MYHFVRDLEHSRYPGIKGLSLNAFREQIEYIRSHYNLVKMEDLIEVIDDPKQELPPRASLLTFDDGYIDHFINVFPILDEMKVQGSFFPPAKPIVEGGILDVNKIHFVLASLQDPASITAFIFSKLDEHRDRYSLEDNSQYYSRLSKPNRYDSRDVTFIKKILQRELPELLRREIVDELFRKYVTEDEASFSRELYMTEDQLKCMHRNGMYLGSHGYDHYWLDSLDERSQEREVDLSLDFLRSLGAFTKDWVMCYPYGAYDNRVLSILKQRGCKIGLSTQVEIADTGKLDSLSLPRLDTNDLPKHRHAGPNLWTLKAKEIAERA
jgi:peptidoglycan/xylan/chitin deacetylase (PgdA/CDA1 family)